MLVLDMASNEFPAEIVIGSIMILMIIGIVLLICELPKKN